VGCSVFGYYYFKVPGISVPHGRAPAVATGIVRSRPDFNVVCYQGDGDLGAIGLNELLQAANRGENITVLFVNNAIYGMTGGQMAPTTLPGQKTQTSPYGRSVENEGFPMKICEMVAALDSPVYVERVALNNPANIRKAKSALRKAFTYMRDKKGFSLVEFLSSCPVNLKMSPPESDKWISEKMISYFPLSKFKDIGAERQPKKNMKPVYDSDIVRDLLYPQEDNFNDIEKISEKKDFTIKIKCAGFGGQGILSLGMIIAEAAHQQGFQVTWLPSYGPEMRGGTANCSVVISSKKISSPIIEKADVMIIFSQLAMDKFKNDMENNGILIYDENNVNTLKDEPDNYRIFNFNASEIAKNLGDSRIANTLMLGATSHFIKEISRNSFLKAIRKAFANKEHILDLNLRAFGEGQKIAMQRYSKEN
ncbi:MAG TPA: 2-oxoacid:acceptor oxidoreductase family protein, partial [Victivallales bacterium]|nr:2-oxoacid:acceptor oxidoreductase family protein [Victivallales bacterium]